MTRIAVVSDIHGNLTALETVLADLRLTSPDVIFHGGDLADSGARPVEVADLIRSLGWRGVVGNTDEMLAAPASFEAFAAGLPALENLWTPLREMAAWTRDALGEDRLSWLRELPREQAQGEMTLVHASPESRWSAPMSEAADNEIAAVYANVMSPVVVYGHIHRPFVRRIRSAADGAKIIANSGSAGQPHDGDRRAGYLLLDGAAPTIRRVEYDVDRELKALAASGLPHSDWVARILQSGSPQMP